MNLMIKTIVQNNTLTKEQKLNKLNILERDIFIAKEILSDKFAYCEECDDYYLTPSFIKTEETKEEDICIFSDPINSSGNEYKKGLIKYTYLTCPKGHKHFISRREV